MSNKREQLDECEHDSQPMLTIYGHQGGIRRVEYLPGGERLVTGSLDKTIRIWNVADGSQEGSSMVHETVVWDLAVTKDGGMIFSSDGDGEITIWVIGSRQPIEKWTHQETHPRIAVSPDGRLVAYGNRTVIIRELNGLPTSSKTRSYGHNTRHCIETGSGINSLSFSPDGRKLACGMKGVIRVHDVVGGQLVFELKQHEGLVWPILWSQKETRVYSASEDKTICCWNSETGEPIGAPWTGHTDSVYTLSLSANETTLASGSQDGTIRFWDTQSGQLVGHPLRLEHPPWSIRISPSNDFVASVCSDGEIVLWHVPWLNDTSNQLIDRTCPPTPSALIQPHTVSRESIFPASDSTPEWAPQQGPPYKHGQNNQSFSVPLDLTPHIVRIDDRYWEGGSFGDVYKCLYNSHAGAREVAIKAFRFRFALEEKNDSSGTVKMIRRELGIWKRLDHVNIVPFLGIATGFGMHGSMSLVSAWMPNGSLHRFLATHDEQLHAAHRLKVLLDIANGLQYLHSFPISPIVHGDLNGNNVLVDGEFTARLADFGYASVVGNIPEALTYLQRSTSRPGALRWTAPELVLYEETSQRTPKSDVYSFGCMMLQALSGKQPWSEVREDGAIVLRMVRGEKPKRPESSALEDRHWELIQRCWSSVEERPTAGTLTAVLEEFLRYCPQSPSLREIYDRYNVE